MLANHCERLALQAFFHQSYSRPLAYHPLAGPDAHGKALGAALLDMVLETLQERACSRDFACRVAKNCEQAHACRHGTCRLYPVMCLRACIFAV